MSDRNHLGRPGGTPVWPYHGRVRRLAARRITRRLLPGVALATALAGCGAPPQPLPTAPPGARESGSLVPSGMAYPSAGPPMGSLRPGGYPSGGVPAGAIPSGLPGYPTGLLPTLRSTPTRTPSPTRPTPSPAPVCPAGPTKQQVLAVIEGKPGIPNEPLEVRYGPYCSGSWQLAIVGIVGATAAEAEELLVVTTGQPTSLQLVEAGADVCTDRVMNDAPPGIRVRACGS